MSSTPVRLVAVAALALVAACQEPPPFQPPDGGVADAGWVEEKPIEEGPFDPIEPVAPEVSCAASFTAAGPLTKLGGGIRRPEYVEIGACGHVTFFGGGQWLADPDLRSARLLERTRAATFAPDGLSMLSRIGADGGARIRIAPLTTDTRDTFEGEDAYASGFTRSSDPARRAPVYLCNSPLSPPFGLARVVEGKAELLDPARCDWPLAATHDDTLVYRSGDATRFAHLASGELGTVQGLDYRVNEGDAQGRWRSDGLHLSNDGRVLLHQIRWAEFCGDTQCAHYGASAQLYDLVSGRRFAEIPAALFTDWTLSSPPAVLAPDARSSALVVRQQDGATVVDESLGVRRLTGIDPLHVFRDGKHALALKDVGERRPDLALVRLEAGTSHVLVQDPYPDEYRRWIALSDSEAHLAVSRGPVGCAMWPDRPGVCHWQLWQLDQWDLVHGTRREVGKATQPIAPVWAGDDGALLAAGRFFDGAPPATAGEDAREPQWTTRLIASDGRLLQTWSESAAFATQAGRTLLVVFGSYGHQRLEVVNLDTGRHMVLFEGRQTLIALDERRERLYVLLTPTGDTSGESELWAGAVPSVP